VPVDLTTGLRDLVQKAAKEMHAYFDRGYTPRVKPFKGCRSCSLADICLPQLQNKAMSALAYIQQQTESA
jgi:CRISPR-associated exonuclease Cas4